MWQYYGYNNHTHINIFLFIADIITQERLHYWKVPLTLRRYHNRCRPSGAIKSNPSYDGWPSNWKGSQKLWGPFHVRVSNLCIGRNVNTENHERFSAVIWVCKRIHLAIAEIPRQLLAQHCNPVLIFVIYISYSLIFIRSMAIYRKWHWWMKSY